jgi:hypothetical protein
MTSVPPNSFPPAHNHHAQAGNGHRQFIGYVQQAVLGLFALGFLSWAAIVWKAREDVQTMNATLMTIEKQLDQVHAELAAAKQTQLDVTRLQTQQDDFRAEIERRLTYAQQQINDRLSKLER